MDNELLYALIISHITGDISAEEQSLLDKMLAESDDAREIYDDMCRTLKTAEATNIISGFSAIQPPALPADKKQRYIFRYVGIAAAVAVVIVGVTQLIPKSQKVNRNILSKRIELNFNNGEIFTPNHTDTTVVSGRMRLSSVKNMLTYKADIHNSDTGILKVPKGKYYGLTLSDGTKIYLSAATTIRFPFSFSGPSREVWVNGEAFFDVAKNTKPFYVHLPQSDVQVLGTTFNISSDDKKEVVSLVTGSVHVKKGNHTIPLKPATQVIMTADSSRVSYFTVENIPGRNDGIRPYSEITLADLAVYIGKCYDVKVIINRKPENKRFYGVINQNEPIRDFLNELIDTNKGLKYTIQGDVVTIN